MLRIEIWVNVLSVTGRNPFKADSSNILESTETGGWLVLFKRKSRIGTFIYI
jgi:hypothetical protein